MPKTSLTPEVQDVVLTLMEGLNCPRSLTVAIMVRYGEWDLLTQLKVDPKHHLTPDSYLDAAAASDFLRKCEGLPLELDLKGLAIEKWYWAERECYKTNRRLNEILDFGTLNGSPVDERILQTLEDLKKHVLWLIGSAPPQSFDGFFGPGATVSDTALRATVPHKMSSNPTLTASALYYLVPWTGTKWATACAERGDVVSVVEGDIFFTVPKDSRNLRGCSKGPAINVFYQLGLGRIWRERLRVRGIDLSDGQDVHRQVACAASKSGEFCTIDLTSASDCNATALVRHALPPGWFAPANDLRSAKTFIDGKWVVTEKFSAMGNGFTFELESTIFMAICLTAMKGAGIPGQNVWVYGDDIIVPTQYQREVLALLKFFGFTPNTRKTFVDGYFRESCGGDFFDGVAVRPFFLKELPYEPQHYIAMANGIRRLACNNGRDPTRWTRLRRAWFKCLDLLPSHIRQCRGPEQLGDLCIHDDEPRWAYRWRANCIRYIRVYRPAKFLGTRWDRFDPDVQFAAALYGVALRQIVPARKGLDNRSVLGRDSVTGYKVGWTPFS